MTSATTSAPTLQTLSDAAASAWLLQWSGLVGFVAARAAARHSQGRQAVQQGHRRATTTLPAQLNPRGFPRTYSSKDKAVSGHRAAQKGKATQRCSKTAGGVVLRYEEAALGDPTHTQPQLPGPPGRAAEGNSIAGARWYGVRLSSDHLSPSCVPAAVDGTTVRLNVERCSSYLSSHLPPLLLERVVDTAWRTVSEEVTLGGRESSVPDHQVGEWARRAPVLLGLAAGLSGTKYPLDLTGIAPDALWDVVAYVESQFPVERLSTLVLSKRKATYSNARCLLDGDVLRRLLQRSLLVSLTLNLEMVSGSVLKEISQMSLQELDVCGGGHSEAQVLQELCGLPFSAVDQVVEAVRGSHLEALPVTPLRKSLRKLSVSLPSLPSAMYQVFLAVFHKLQHYSPPSGATPCVSGYARMAGQPGATKPLSLLSLNLGRASRHEILEVARVCPALRDVSLSIELDCEETLSSLRACERLSGVQLSYYPPSVSAPPKVEGSVLLPLLDLLGPQLLSLSLTGFSLKGGVVEALARLPELRRLTLVDSWLSRPDAAPCHPFPSLDSLALNFMLQLDTLQLLTASSCLQSLDIDVVASEARGNGLTDASVKQLVSSSAISSIHSFSSSSPFLTLASLRHLAALPRLKSVGCLARWGLTEEELRCVGHSGPPHVLCRH